MRGKRRESPGIRKRSPFSREKDVSLMEFGHTHIRRSSICKRHVESRRREAGKGGNAGRTPEEGIFKKG